MTFDCNSTSKTGSDSKMKYHSSQFSREDGAFGNFLLQSYFGPSKAILAHNRGTAPFPLSKKGVARRNLVCDIWLTGGSTNGAEKEPQDWGALVADGRKELISFKRCLFLRHVWHVSEVVANIFTQRYFLTFHISFLRFYSLKEQPPVILSHFLTGVISVGRIGTEEWGVVDVPFATIPFPFMHGLSPTS